MERKIGIVMPCINLWQKYTFPALLSVATAQRMAAEKGITTEVLLIDNGSTDETHHAAKDRAGITYHRNEERWGFQKSVNFGVNHFFNKGFTHVLVLNNDIVLHENAIWRLLERFKKSEIPVVEIENSIPMEDTLAMVTCLDATGECKRNPANVPSLNDKEKEACPETPNPCFSAFMLNRNCWKTVGEFDEVFFPAYYEDNDYHYRIQLAGLDAITYPPAMFFHWGSATQLEALGRPLTDTSNQHAQFVRKWGGNPGQEVFKHPYNDEAKPITSVSQMK